MSQSYLWFCPDCLSSMRGAASISFLRSIKKQVYPFQGTWGGIVPSLEPKRPTNEESSKGRIRTIADEKAAESIVAFSRPPPLPPFLGPLIILSLWDPWSRNDNNDVWLILLLSLLGLDHHLMTIVWNTLRQSVECLLCSQVLELWISIGWGSM